MIRKDNILSRQNPILKVLISLILVIISSIVSFDKFLILFAFTFLYLIVSPVIYLVWLKAFIKIIPFFISLFIFGFLFKIPFPNQCYLSARIIHILLISVYLVETSSMDLFITRKKYQESEFWFRCNFFLAATIYFIPIFTLKFNDNRKIHENILDVIMISMEDCVKEIHNVEIAVINKVRINNDDNKVVLWPNIYLFLLIIIPCFFIISNYN